MEQLKVFFEKYGVTEVGAVSFESCLPLLTCRAAERLPEAAKTVLVCLFPYYVGEENPRNISRYAMVPDYHLVAGGILRQICGELTESYSHSFEAFVDNSPIREVDTAARAGLGVVGRNGLLLHPVYGSYCFIGEIVTDMPMVTREQQKKDCLQCGLCEQACPTDCIAGNGAVCLSAVTQQKGVLTHEEERLVAEGGLLWGCDRCQEVCPMNRSVPGTPIASFRADLTPFLQRQDLTASVKKRAYGFRGVQPLLRNFSLLYPENTTECIKNT